MSSLAAARADNFYYPPEWDPSKGSLNKSKGKAAGTLGARAKKADQGILVIRFEMPYNVWCEHCHKMIGRGVRYNAEKKACGKYFSTTIWQFSMKCHLCDGILVVQTDPKNTDYVCISGLRKKEEEWDEEDNGTLTLVSTEEKEKREADPFYKLEHATVPDVVKSKEEKCHVAALKSVQDVRAADDGNLNRLLRKRFRDTKKELAATNMRNERESKRLNLGITLLPHDSCDKEAAAKVKFTGSRRASAFSQNKIERRTSIQSRGIFDPPGGSSLTGIFAPSRGVQSLSSPISRSSATTTSLGSSLAVTPSSPALRASSTSRVVPKDPAAAAVAAASEAKELRLSALRKQHANGIDASLFRRPAVVKRAPGPAVNVKPVDTSVMSGLLGYDSGD